jgi:RNA polymerase sigma-70 factor (ECF subfamily)
MREPEVIAACLRGDVDAFRTIVEAHETSLLAAAIAILGNREDAEDACQEAFLQAFRHLGDYDARRNFKTWITVILCRRCLDLAKKKRRFRSALERVKRETPLVSLPRPADPGTGRVGEDILGRLSPRERAVVTLWANEGFTAAEISSALSCSDATARVVLHNVRKKLKTFLENRHAPLGPD